MNAHNLLTIYKTGLQRCTHWFNSKGNEVKTLPYDLEWRRNAVCSHRERFSYRASLGSLCTVLLCFRLTMCSSDLAHTNLYLNHSGVQ